MGRVFYRKEICVDLRQSADRPYASDTNRRGRLDFSESELLGTPLFRLLSGTFLETFRPAGGTPFQSRSEEREPCETQGR